MPLIPYDHPKQEKGNWSVPTPVVGMFLFYVNWKMSVSCIYLWSPMAIIKNDMCSLMLLVSCYNWERNGKSTDWSTLYARTLPLQTYLLVYNFHKYRLMAKTLSNIIFPGYYLHEYSHIRNITLQYTACTWLYQNIPVDNIFVLFPDGSISLFGLASILVVCLDIPLDKAT